MTDQEKPCNVWREYDALACDMARRYRGKIKVGDSLPDCLSKDVVELINEDPEAFIERVRLSAYALAMEGKL